ncbi:hypothetical protein CHS0354_016497 [Potamilus streckersoni]|uniref:Uncharacterized protein n=1 Tax=Potamilus streckersoni TaxID=2493646 RepID=A0AAE0VWI9_9BIVA|nr:hypothetical protein CHS0354_016497 [Potamilus streckersoni]
MTLPQWFINGMSSSAKHEKITSTSLNHTLDAAFTVDNQDYMLQHGNNDSYTNHHEMCNCGIMEDISEPSNYIYSVVDSEVNVATYATVKPKDVQKASNGSKSITSEVNEQLNDPNKIGSENVTGNVYDKANFHLRDGLNDQSDTIYDTTNESSKSMYQSNEMYNKVKCGRTGEYMTYVTRMDTDFTYDHV